jgi:hypothetical protein
MQKSMGRCEWGGRISGTKGGDQEGSDGVMRCREEGQDGMGGWDVLACRMKRLARELWGNGGITYHVYGHGPLGAMREE